LTRAFRGAGVSAAVFSITSARKNAGGTLAPREPFFVHASDEIHFADQFPREKCALLV